MKKTALPSEHFPKPSHPTHPDNFSEKENLWFSNPIP
jgi:hypothetical protein